MAVLAGVGSALLIGFATVLIPTPYSDAISLPCGGTTRVDHDVDTMGMSLPPTSRGWMDSWS